MSFLVPYLFVLLISLEELVGLIEVCFHLFFDANLRIPCLFLMLFRPVVDMSFLSGHFVQYVFWVFLLIMSFIL